MEFDIKPFLWKNFHNQIINDPEFMNRAIFVFQKYVWYLINEKQLGRRAILIKIGIDAEG